MQHEQATIDGDAVPMVSEPGALVASLEGEHAAPATQLRIEVGSGGAAQVSMFDELGSAPSASYEVAFEFAARNMPGRMGDPVAPLAHEFAAWAEDAWTSGHIDAAFERWVVDVKAPVRPGLAGD